MIFKNAYLIIFSHSKGKRKNVSQNSGADRTVISAGNEESILLANGSRVTEKSEIFRITSSVWRMFKNTFTDPNVTAEMKEVELVVVTGLDVVVVVGIPSEDDHVVA